MDEEFRIFRGGRGRHGRHWRRGRGYRHYPLVYPYYSTVVTAPSKSYTDCIHAVGACSDQMKREVGEYGLEHPEEVCRKVSVQDYVRELGGECKPSKEGYYENYHHKYVCTGETMGVL